MATKEQVHARHGVVTDPLANEPFWRRPLPPIQGRNAVADDPLADDSDPLADTPSSESLENFAPPHASTTAQPHDDAADSAPELEIPTPVSFPASEAEPEASVMSTSAASSPTLSVAELQRRLVGSQLKMADAIEQQREQRGRVNVARGKFQQLTSVATSPSDLIRQHIASENEQRRLRAEGKLAPRGGQRRLGSAIDAYAFHTRAMGRGAGGGRAFGRGAKPASMRGMTIAPKE